MIDSETEEVVFLGDVFLPNAVSAELPYEHVVINLESPITTSEEGVPGKVNLKSSQNHLPNVFGNSLLAVCLANNHISDYDAAGLADTLRHLNSMGVKSYGVGETQESAAAHLLITVAGKKVALLGCVSATTSPLVANDQRPGVALIDRSRVKSEIARARAAGADHVVVTYHWGAEHVPLPTVTDIETARHTIEDGADVVIGHHAHCIQSSETYNRKRIFFGIGNCIFPNLDTPSYFRQKDKTPTRRFRMRQERWNKTSLAIRLNVVSGEIRTDKLFFSGDKLRVLKADIRPFRFSHGVGTIYTAIFHAVFFLAKLRRILMNFLRNPKIPRLKHLRGILKLAGTRKYS